MRSARCAWLFCLFLVPFPIWAQQSAPTTAQGAVILQRAFGVLAGSASLADVTLTGTARRIAGSDDETGTAVLKALATGEARMDFGFPSGQRSEARTNSANGAAGTWTGPDGKVHPQSQHNLMTDSSWFFPALVLGRLVSSKNSSVSLLGRSFGGGPDAIQGRFFL